MTTKILKIVYVENTDDKESLYIEKAYSEPIGTWAVTCHDGYMKVMDINEFIAMQEPSEIEIKLREENDNQSI